MTIINRNNNSNKGEKESNSFLKGIYVYEENVKYTFDGKGNGALIMENEENKYTYKVEDNRILINFEDEDFQDATYSYSLEDNTLKLVGEEGTAGGAYILKKESK